MPSQEVAAAVKSRLQSNWTSAAIPVLGPNESSKAPSDGAPYLEYDFPTQGSNHVGLGGLGERTFRDDGTIRLMLNVPRMEGVDAGLALANDLRDLFVGTTFDGVTTFSPSPPRIDGNAVLGKYFRLSVIVPYTFDWQA